MIVDLKVVRDFNLIYDPAKKKKLHFIDFWRYDIQGAIYQEIVRQNTGKTLPFYLAVVTKEPEPDLNLFWIPDDTLEAALEFVQSLVKRYQKIITKPINYKSVYDCEVDDI